MQKQHRLPRGEGTGRQERRDGALQELVAQIVGQQAAVQVKLLAEPAQPCLAVGRVLCSPGRQGGSEGLAHLALHGDHHKVVGATAGQYEEVDLRCVAAARYWQAIVRQAEQQLGAGEQGVVGEGRRDGRGEAGGNLPGAGKLEGGAAGLPLPLGVGAPARQSSLPLEAMRM